MLILPLRDIFKATRAVCAYALKRGLKNAVLLACGLLMQFLERAGSFLRMRNSDGEDGELVPWKDGVACYVGGKAVITMHYLWYWLLEISVEKIY